MEERRGEGGGYMEEGRGGRVHGGGERGRMHRGGGRRVQKNRRGRGRIEEVEEGKEEEKQKRGGKKEGRKRRGGAWLHFVASQFDGAAYRQLKHEAHVPVWKVGGAFQLALQQRLSLVDTVLRKKCKITTSQKLNIPSSTSWLPTYTWNSCF